MFAQYTPIQTDNESHREVVRSFDNRHRLREDKQVGAHSEVKRMTEISRREVLLSGVATAGLLSAAVGAEHSNNDSWIDAHSHIWTADTTQFGLQPGLTVDDLAPRSFDDTELMTVARPLGVNRVVLISAHAVPRIRQQLSDRRLPTASGYVSVGRYGG